MSLIRTHHWSLLFSSPTVQLNSYLTPPDFGDGVSALYAGLQPETYGYDYLGFQRNQLN